MRYLLLKHMVRFLSELSEDKYPHYTPIEIDVSQEPLVAAMIGALGNITCRTRATPRSTSW